MLKQTELSQGRLAVMGHVLTESYRWLNPAMTLTKLCRESERRNLLAEQAV